MNAEPFITIPTWESGKWTSTSFPTRDHFKDFCIPLFKEPGKYKFDETSLEFNSQAHVFRKQGFFCASPKDTRDYKNYWDDQKSKCRKGAIFKSGKETWYIPRDYYMWINFLKIYDKANNKFDFPGIRDVQYHLALYELLAELHYKHAAIVKKRQCAISYFHCAKLVNQIWFEEGVSLKMGASLKDYINEKGTWKFLDEYKAFLNEHTAWYRPMNPGKPLSWKQVIKVRKGARDTEVGEKGTIQGMSFEKDPATGVGGACKVFFHEESGIAPKMDITYGYIGPAMKDGDITTGIFIAAGSVGDLDQCLPLKNLVLYPDANDIYAVDSTLIDDKLTPGRTGLFIPEQWSRPPYIDQFGNSDVEEALRSLDIQFAQWKKDLSPEQYQLKVSQHPRNLEEAFAFRKTSPFPAHILLAQQRRIQDKEYSYEFLELRRSETGPLEAIESSKLPISEFPLSKVSDNKEGVLVVWERPVNNPQFGMYYASIDPIGEGKTTTSDSLCSIQILKNAVEVTKIDTAETKTHIEHEKLVASWCGRFDDINITHERLSMILEWYNAWAVVENNISLFIQYMISKRRQRYLVPKDQILFLKDLGANNNVYQEYGWKNTGTLFKTHLLSYAIEYIREQLDIETKPDGEIVRIKYGVERIPDPMLIKEMLSYVEGLNVDRLVSFAALVAFVRIQQSNRGYIKRVEDTQNLHKSDNFRKLTPSPFRHIGKGNHRSSMRPPRSPYKNLK